MEIEAVVEDPKSREPARRFALKATLAKLVGFSLTGASYGVAFVATAIIYFILITGPYFVLLIIALVTGADPGHPFALFFVLLFGMIAAFLAAAVFQLATLVLQLSARLHWSAPLILASLGAIVALCLPLLIYGPLNPAGVVLLLYYLLLCGAGFFVTWLIVGGTAFGKWVLKKVWAAGMPTPRVSESRS